MPLEALMPRLPVRYDMRGLQGGGPGGPRPAACQNWEQGCSDGELNSELPAKEELRVCEDTVGRFLSSGARRLHLGATQHSFKLTDIKYLSCGSSA